MRNIERWPTFFRVVQIVDSFLSKLLNIYLIVGVVNENQLNEVGNDIDLHVKLEIEADKYVIASLTTEERLGDILGQYRSRAAHWRGQYQAMSKALVAACEAVLAK